jgi:glycosyltransferase involved in cell wall biosynthesis
MVTKTTKLVGQHSLSIIVPAYNAEETIGKCIESLLTQTVSKKMPTEIIIVDDGSTDRTKEIVKKYPVSLIEIDHSGPSVARNTGYMHSSGDIVFFVEADAYYDSEHIEYLVKHLLNDPKTGTVIGRGEPWSASSIFYSYWKQAIKLKQINYKPIGGFIFRRQDLEKIGLYDPFLWGGEDVELCMKLKKIGLHFVYEPKARVWHKEAYSLVELMSKSFRKGSNILNFYEKLGIKIKRLFISLAFVVLPLLWLGLITVLTITFSSAYPLFIVLGTFMTLYSIPCIRILKKHQKISDYKVFIALNPILSVISAFSFSLGYVITYIRNSARKIGNDIVKSKK